MSRDLRTGMYGLNADDLREADRMGLSPWDYAEQYKGVGAPIKELTPEEKKTEWRRLLDEQLSEHRDGLKIWMDGDSKLWLGWYRTAFDGQWIIVRALVQTQTQTIVAVPMRRHRTDAVEGVAWERPWMGQQVWDKIKGYRKIVPPGVF